MATREALRAQVPNIQRPIARQKSGSTKPFAPSPLKKQSDYELVAPLSTKAKPIVASRPPPPAPSAAANVPQKTGAPTTPNKPANKARKKFLCATPPTTLQNSKARTEYDRGRQLGEGGFARCFLVQNKNGNLYAAKTVSKKSLSTQKMKTKFFGEIQVHRRMDHPNIVKFVECFEDDDNVYMILELCPNKSLMEMLRKRKRFTEPEARFFLLQLLGALKYMHGKRVIHRDLKLGNIFLDHKMNIKIGDFGLAALLVEEDERKKTICGTPNYIAPEVLFEGGKNGGGHSYEVDLWGFGVIMYAMLVGKPPFQSTNVDAIYQKIRDNSFEWPAEVSVSLSAKSLVNALLNRDPGSRPSLDEIASHPFFKTGYFPKSIPLDCLTGEPFWPSAGPGSVMATRQEWRQNYDHVAKGSGIGVDSSGNEIESAGAQIGSRVSLLAVPASRPSSAASSTLENDAPPAKILEKKRREVERKVSQPEKDAYILPEALSPRDGHARMRNVNVLKSTLATRTAPTRGGGLFPPRQASVPQPPTMAKLATPEKIDDDETEDEVPLPELRQLRKQPIRRTRATEAAPATRAKAVPQQSVFPPTTRVTRSHAAVQRAATVAEPAPSNSEPPAANLPLRRAHPAESAVTPVANPVQPSSRPDSFAKPVGISASEKTAPKSSSPKSSPDPIPFEPHYSSKVGVAIPATAGIAVIESLKPFVKNLNAFTSSTLYSLPPQPRSTTNAVQAFKDGKRNTHIFISKWVDYTNKYGVAYILTDGTCAALFNDNTSLIVDSVGGKQAEFITPSLIGNTDTVFRRLATEMAIINEKRKTSKGLANKVTMWKRFGNYMKTTLGSEESWNCERESIVREPSVSAKGVDEGMLFVTHYARLKRCAVFRFLDGGFQFNFIDHTKVLVSSGGRTLRLITREHVLIVTSLEEAYSKCQESDMLFVDFGLKAKISYIKEVLKAWVRRGRFPEDIEAREGEDKPVVVLGDGKIPAARTT